MNKMTLEEARKLLEDIKNQDYIFNLLEKKDKQIDLLEKQSRNLDRQAQQYFEEIIKKDKIIDLMCEQLAGLAIFDVKADETIILMDKEEVKQYFEKEASKDES